MNDDLLRPDDTRDALRKLGGLLLGLAALMIYIRKGPFLTVNPHQWASFPMFLVLAIPAVYLYGGILSGAGPESYGPGRWCTASSG